MEIKAKSKFDLDSMKALIHLTMFKKADPKKRMILWSVVYLVLSAIIIFEIIAFDTDAELFVLLGVEALLIMLMYYWYFMIPKIRYKALANLKDAENEYIFCPDSLKATTKTAEYNGEAEIEYSLFTRVYETSKYFFLFQANHYVYLIDKYTIEGGAAEDIRNKLMNSVKDKYTICKY